MSKSDIWKTLSAIDVSAHVEKKGQFSYLSWAWAWGTLMEHYPEATYEMHAPQYVGDGDQKTAMVSCTVAIGEQSRYMWLPCMNFQNNAKNNPDVKDVSDTRMRCLVKCIAMFGLGHYLYAGEDLPRTEPPAGEPEEQIACIEDLLIKMPENTVDGFLEYYKVKRPADIPHYQLADAIIKLEKKLGQLEKI